MRRTSLFEAVPAHERKPAGLPGQRGASANRSGILRDIYIRDLGKEHSQKLDVRARKLDSITTNAAKTLTDAKPKFRASEGLNKLVNYLSIQTAGKVKKINALKEERRKLKEKVFDKDDMSTYADLKYEIYNHRGKLRDISE